MQICNCLVRLGGDARHTVEKRAISVSEIAVLEAIHGSGSVEDIQPVENDKRSHKDELEDLARRYAPKATSDRGNVVRQLFPGMNPTLPVTLEEIGKVNPNKPAKKKAAGKGKKTSDAESVLD